MYQIKEENSTHLVSRSIKGDDVTRERNWLPRLQTKALL